MGGRKLTFSAICQTSQVHLTSAAAAAPERFASLANLPKDFVIIRTSLSFTANRARGGSPIAAQTTPRGAAVRGDKPAPALRARHCDYTAPAALFVRTSSGLRYRSFESASLAVRHANEELNGNQLRSCIMEVGDARFVGEELERLYAAPGYPLPRRESAEA